METEEGIPIRKISITNPSFALNAEKFNWSILVFLMRITLEYRVTEINILNTVAQAAPRTPISNPKIKMGSRIMFTTVAVI
jgi:hypothetical protein